MQPRPPLFSTPFALVLLAGVGGGASFYLLLSVVPLYVAEGPGGDLAAGLTTGAMMASTVATELFMTRLLARFGYQRIYVAGLLLLAAPALLLAVSSALWLVISVCLARGVGLAIVVVTASAIVAEVLPAERRGEGVGVYGLAFGIPSIIALPLGVWLVPQVGFDAIFVAGAAFGLLAVPIVLPLRVPESANGASTSILGGLRMPGLARPAFVFLTTTVAAGVTATFLPLVLPPDLRPLAWLALLVQAISASFMRWAAGRAGDRIGAGRLLLPAMLATAVGLAVLIWTPNLATLLGGMLVFGVGFGVAQNVTISMMYERVPRSEYGTVSAVWNLAYDAGVGLGAIGFGAIAQGAGYAAAFACTTALLMLATALSRRA
jgi:MFS family permease